jgi:hypothetical protein
VQPASGSTDWNAKRQKLPSARRHLPGPTEYAPPCAAAQPLFAGQLPPLLLPCRRDTPDAGKPTSPPIPQQEPTLVSTSTHASVTLSQGRGRIDRRDGAAGWHPSDKELRAQCILNQVQERPADIAEQHAQLPPLAPRSAGGCGGAIPSRPHCPCGARRSRCRCRSCCLGCLALLFSHLSICSRQQGGDMQRSCSTELTLASHPACLPSDSYAPRSSPPPPHPPHCLHPHTHLSAAASRCRAWRQSC